MRKIITTLFSSVFIFCTLGIASALTFDDSVRQQAWINHNGTGVYTGAIFSLDLPDWYDSTLVDVFNITLIGKYASPTRTIELFLREENGSAWYNAGSYLQPATNDRFRHTFDIIGSGFDLGLFDSDSNFDVAYGCHFLHKKTKVHIEQNPVPEPATIFLLGSGLVGIAGFGRKKFRKK